MSDARHILVSGGTSGINRAIAERFASRGDKVSVFSRKQDKVDDTVAQLKTLGASAFGTTADVRDAEAVEKAVAAAVEAHGEIDVLVSGAAGNFLAPAAGMSANAFGSVVGIDLQGSFHVARAALEHLRKPGGCLIHISAPQAFVPMMFQSHVCAAKAGVDMLTRTLALEWGPLGVRVNSIVPGAVDGTEGMKRLADPAMKDELRRTIPLGRLSEVGDCADVAEFLASPQAGYITGVVLPVDGGWSLAGASMMQYLMMKGS
jgi:NAD(P)-dependent dehydrogenase (short-subunit alcohol dehydrogenase family)